MFTPQKPQEDNFMIICFHNVRALLKTLKPSQGIMCEHELNKSLRRVQNAVYQRMCGSNFYDPLLADQPEGMADA